VIIAMFSISQREREEKITRREMKCIPYIIFSRTMGGSVWVFEPLRPVREKKKAHPTNAGEVSLGLRVGRGGERGKRRGGPRREKEKFGRPIRKKGGRSLCLTSDSSIKKGGGTPSSSIPP